MDIQYWYPVKARYYQPATHSKWINDTFGKDLCYVDVMTYYFEKEEHAIFICTTLELK